MRRNNSLDVRYDGRADVLYIVFSERSSARAVEDAFGIFWRFDDKGAPLSATVMDAFDRWHDDQKSLARRLGDRFHAPNGQIESAVQKVFSNISGEHRVST